jgi:hypothetical protein
MPDEHPEHVEEHTKKFVVGTRMHCPRCMRLQNVIAYRPLQTADNFVAEQANILKCPTCGWLFAPRISLDELQTIVDNWMQEFADDPDRRSKVHQLLEAVAS